MNALVCRNGTFCYDFLLIASYSWVSVKSCVWKWVDSAFLLYFATSDAAFLKDALCGSEEECEGI